MTLRQLINKIKERRFWRAISAVAIILLAGALIELMSLIQFRYTHRLMETELDYHTESEMTLKSVRVKGMLLSNEKMVRNVNSNDPKPSTTSCIASLPPTKT